MIPFEEIEERLKAIGKSRAWLADASGRPLGSIRVALAPNSPAKNRSALLQKALSDAIEREEASQKNAVILPDRITIEAPTEEARRWNELAAKEGITVHEWAVRQLEKAAKDWKKQTPENVLAFPEVPLFHAAAGAPAAADADTYAPLRELGPGRIACQLHGDSMAPKYPDRSIVILRERGSLKRPVLKNGQIYLFVLCTGEQTLKVYQSRPATSDEQEAGISYVSPKDGIHKVRILRSLNPDHADIVVSDEVNWLGWLDKDDNP